MAKIRRKKTSKKKSSQKTSIEGTQPSDKIKQYFHNYTKRANNPPVGLVTPETDMELPTKHYSYDPHLDPQLIWAGKKEHTSFEVDTVSLHVHERIDPMTIIEKILKQPRSEFIQKTLFGFFDSPENNPPLREAIEFYKHDQSWSNRLIAGDSLLIMNSLLQKEGLGEKIQMIYMDPPYGITYGSNFQPFINKKIVVDGNDEDLTQEPEVIRAFRDTWEIGIHSYLSYLRDRLLLAKDLLHESGSCFIQISEENVHLVREVMDEIFGAQNFISQIIFRKKKMPLGSKYLEYMCDYVLYYAKDKEKMKYRQLFVQKDVQGDSKWCFVEEPDGTRRRLTKEEHVDHTLLSRGSNVYYRKVLRPAGFNENAVFPIIINGKKIYPQPGKSWSTSEENVKILLKKHRIELSEDEETVNYVVKLNDFPVSPLTSHWPDTSAPQSKSYVVQTSEEPIKRCILMSTDPGDLILDPTCGSGTTAFVAEQWGRRWITCDTSRVAIAVAKQRLMQAIYPNYELAYSKEGVFSGFKYKTVPHITLSSIVNDELSTEILYDQPIIDKSKIRVSGPFTVEAVPSPTVQSSDNENVTESIDVSLSRVGETLRQDEWRNELLKTGIRGKNNQKIEFSRAEVLSVTQWLHVDAETKEKEPKRVVISFGPEHAPLEQRQVARAIDEAQQFVPKPKIIVFAAFQFDPEASKDIDELKWPNMTILKAQMNADLLTKDLKKERSSNESFWLIGQPDIQLKKSKDGKYVVEVNGFDYYNTKTGEIDSGDSSRISMWMLDTDYDGRSLYPQQVFFPISGNDGWSKLEKSLKTEINEDLLEQYRGIISLPFIAGPNKQIAVKIIDDRGIESLRILRIE